jgi:hypothetical protein
MSRRKRKPKYWCKRVRCDCGELVDPRGLATHHKGQKHLEKMRIDDKVVIGISLGAKESTPKVPPLELCIQHEWMMERVLGRTLFCVCNICKAHMIVEAGTFRIETR